MKRVRCPKCDSYIIFDETQHTAGQTLFLRCTKCNRDLGVRVGTIMLHDGKNDHGTTQNTDNGERVGELIVLENVFAYKQVLPLQRGDNIIGRYQKGNDIQCPIKSSDPNLDMHHAILSIQHNKNGGMCYVLRDGPSFAGTFVGGELLATKERRIISDGTLFTLGATSVILRTEYDKG